VLKHGSANSQAVLLDAHTLSITASFFFDITKRLHGPCARSVSLKVCLFALQQKSSLLICDDSLRNPQEVSVWRPVTAIACCHKHVYVALTLGGIQKLSRPQSAWKITASLGFTTRFPVRALRVTADQLKLLCANYDGTFSVMSTKGLETLYTVPASSHELANLAVSPENLIITASKDGKVKVWSGAQCVKTLTQHTGAVVDVCVHASGMLCASACESGAVILWDTHSWKPIWQLHIGSVPRCISFNSAASLLYVVPTARSILAIDINTAIVVAEFAQNLKGVSIHYGMISA
jgi:WD40 repeat protein